MHTLIVYTTKYGTTAECALKIKRIIKGEATLVNLKERHSPDISGYDKIIIGSPIYVGRISREASTFCNSNIEQLITKQVGLFVCNIISNGASELESAFPKRLSAVAKSKAALGGKLDFDRLTMPDRLVTKMIGKLDKTIPAMGKGIVHSTISNVEIERFVGKME